MTTMMQVSKQVADAVQDLVSALRYTEDEGTHYHVTDGQELTLMGSLEDLQFHLLGETDDYASELHGDGGEVFVYREKVIHIERIRITDGHGSKTFRVYACDDNTCYIALSDYRL